MASRKTAAVAEPASRARGRENGEAAAFRAYLAALPPEHRAALERVRKLVREAAPGVEEGFSYRLPAFRYGGKALLWMGAAAKHCALYGVEANPADLQGYDTSGRGTVRFTADRPLTAALLRKLVKRRMAKIDGG